MKLNCTVCAYMIGIFYVDHVSLGLTWLIYLFNLCYINSPMIRL